MGDFSEFSLRIRLFLKAYRWHRIDPVPEAKLRRPLTESRVALVSTAGLVLPDQEPFDESILGGDFSFRELPWNIDVRKLVETHRSDSFDHRGIQEDPNLGFPLDRLRELAAEGQIGSVNHRHLSFMGSITAPGRLIHDTAPGAADRLAADEVDVAVLVPV